MKKVKQSKKKKNQQVGKRWPIWLTALLSFVGVGFITGVTVLGVFLAGGFDERAINPSEIIFTYDESLYNSDLGQLEVVDNFDLTITSPTENVTANRVTLSFRNHNVIHTITKDGIVYIDNGIIQVPQTVLIGQTFTVQLIKDNYLTDDNGDELLDAYNNPINWIVGGISTLHARSEYGQILEKDLQIAVDVPVYKTEIQSVNSTGDVTDQIVANETFTLQTKYYPQKSQYIYSDDQNSAIADADKRIKYTYFQSIDAGENSVSMVIDSQNTAHFVAGSTPGAEINFQGYTFKDAARQIEYQSQLGDLPNEQFYSQMLAILASSTVETPSTTKVTISRASIQNFTVNKVGQTISMLNSNTKRIYINRYNYDQSADFLGVNIYSTSGAILENLLPNIALAFDYQGSDPTTGASRFLAVQGGDVVTIDGKAYYLPNSNVANLNHSYWDISSNTAAEIKVTVALLIDGADGKQLFGDPILTYDFNLSITTHVEQALSWSDSSDIEVVLEHTSTGAVDPAEVTGLSDLTIVPDDNIYQDKIFFAWFGYGDKESLRATADRILGSTGYQYEYAGAYAAGNDNLTLFPLTSGSVLTLYDTGNFRLYFGTAVTQDGARTFVEDSQGNRTYQMAVMCSEYIDVACVKSLYIDSVQPGLLDTSAFAYSGNQYFIDQGNTNSLSVSFTVGAESVSVFSDAYNNEYIDLAINDTNGNTITDYFNITARDFTIDPESGVGTIRYTLSLDTLTSLGNGQGLYIERFVLSYNNPRTERIEWPYVVTDRSICIYHPVANSIEVHPDEGYQYNAFITGEETIVVTQTLNPQDDSFVTVIQVGQTQFQSVDAMLAALLGMGNDFVVVTDQKGRTDTLDGEWHFVLIDGNSDAVSINGQTFIFGQVTDETVTLALQSNDLLQSSNSANQVLTMNITSIGITGVTHTTNQDPYADENASEFIPAENVTQVNVSKYGAKGSTGESITLSNLVKFYVDDNQYTNIKFQLSQRYLSTLGDLVVDLFGTDGMITLYAMEDGQELALDNLGTEATSITAVLNGKEITKLQINKDFAISYPITFTISDKTGNGAVNTTFDLNILSNVSISGENYPNISDDNQGNEFYANTELTIKNTVTRHYGVNKDETSFGSLFDGSVDTYYVVQNGINYMLSESNINAVGTFSLSTGQIKFNDFWDVESKLFTVFFRPDGNNYFALNRSISFEVTRNLVIEPIDYTYYVLNENMNLSVLGTFVNAYRASSGESITGVSFHFEFSDYLTIDNNGYVVRADEAPFLFDYNQTELHTTLYVKLSEQQDNEDALSTIDVPIKLYYTNPNGDDVEEDSFDIYSYISDKISYDANDTVFAQTQIVNETEYLMLQQGMTWNLDNNFSQSYSIYASPSNLTGDAIMNSYYGITNNSQGRVTIINARNINEMLAGLNNSNAYMIVYFAAGTDRPSNLNDALAVMYIPLVVSSLGFEYVNYHDGAVADNMKLQTALTVPEQLLEQGVYDEITAGQISQILYEYNFGDTDIAENGLFALPNISFSQNIEIYALDTPSGISSSSDIVKEISITNIPDDTGTTTEKAGFITLNHLTDSYDNFYIALKYTITGINNSRQEFFYLLKVVPDVTVHNPVYAYNGNAEYIASVKGEQSVIELEQTFNSTTLNENYNRFNISRHFEVIEKTEVDGDTTNRYPLTTLEVDAETDLKFWLSVKTQDGTVKKFIDDISASAERQTITLGNYFTENISAGDEISITIISGEGAFYYDDVLVCQTLDYENKVSSVTVGGNDPYHTEAEWENYVDIDFQGSKMYVTPKTDEQIVIEILHSYPGKDGLSIVGGDQTYRFIFNSESSDYSVRFISDQQNLVTDDNHKVFDWTIENGQEGEHSMNITLLQDYLAGGSEAYTEVWNELNISLTKGLIGTDIAGFTHVNQDVAGKGTFTINTLEYISSDRTIEFTLYTSQGYLATLNVTIKANVTVTQNMDSITGGATTSFADVFTLSGNIGNGFDITNYSVEADITGDASILSFTNNAFEVANLVEDKKIDCTFTVTFTGAGETRTFTFSASLTLEKNVTYNSTANGGVVLGGGSINIDASKIFTSAPTGTPKIEYSGNVSNSAFNRIATEDNGQTYKIYTNFVNTITPIEIPLTVKIYFGDTGTYESFTMTYVVTVHPAIQSTPNYPAPNGEQLDREYIDDGATFDEILTDFIFNPAIFASSSTANRFEFKQGVVDDNTVNYNTVLTQDDIYENQSNFNVTVLELSQNAIVFFDENGNGTVDRTEIYSAGSNVPLSSSITFKRGNLGSDGTVTDLGSDAIVTFRVTYQGVTCDYKVYIVGNSLSLQINNVSKNANSGTYTYTDTETNTETSTPVDYETIYVDKTSTTNLFAEHRLAQVTFNADIAEGSYYLVFEQTNADETTTYYASYAQYFTISDRGQTQYIDLGVSMKGKTYCGAYLTSGFDTAGISIDIDGTMSVNTDIAGNTDVASLLSSLDNVDLFATITRTNRIQLYYGGTTNGVAVAFEKYSDSFGNNFLDLSTNVELDTIQKHQVFSAKFDKQDGSSSPTKSFDLQYYYLATIDIDVESKISASAPAVNLVANTEYLSMVEKLGVHHPTNDKPVSSAEFGEGKAQMRFEVVRYDPNSTTSIDENTAALLDTYITKYGNSYNNFTKFKLTVEDYIDVTQGTAYLSPSPITNANKYTYDYKMFPLGAQNLGDYVLTRITYSVSGFEKVFYVVIKITPDYTVSYGGSTANANTDSNTGIIANNGDKIYNITNINSSGNYSSFTLTSSSTANGYVSVKHSNDDAEYATSNFTLTLEKNQTIDGLTYNDSDNVSQKLSADLGRAWKESGNKYTLTSGENSTFASAKEVIFGTQYYMVSATDKYGFTYQIHFSLSSQQNPYFDGETITLTEGDYFDIGAEFKQLIISENSSDGNYSITADPTPPIQTADLSMILVEIKGIDAYLFRDAPNELEEDTDNGGYTTKEGEDGRWSTDDKKYFDVPDIQYISVDKINILDTENNSIIESPIEPKKNSEYQGQETAYSLATGNEQLGGVFNGYDRNRSVYARPTNGGGSSSSSDAFLPFRMPRVSETDIFASTDTAQAQMVITLKYEKDGVVELYDLKLNIVVNRELNILESSQEAPIRDGVAFEVASQFDVSSSYDSATSGQINDATFINDTLEVLVAEQTENVEFEMTLYRNDEAVNEEPAVVTLNNLGNSFAKTQYISISYYIGTNVLAGDSLEITLNQGQGTQFFYITNSNGNIVNNNFVLNQNESDRFTISAFTRDIAYVENASLLEPRGYHTLTKYYIVQPFKTSDGNADTAYSYRVSRNYRLTGYYYQLNKAYTDPPIMPELTSTDGGETSSFFQWNSAFNMMYSDNYNFDSLSSADNKGEYINYLTFSLDDTSGGSGNAEIDSTGKITYRDAYDVQEYIVIIVNMRVSGPDRQFSSGDDTFINMTMDNPLRLRWKEDYHRNVKISQSSSINPIRDGVAFYVKDQVSVESDYNQNDGNMEEIDNSTFVNDTLEVLVAKQSSVQFEMTLKRGGTPVNSSPSVVSISTAEMQCPRTEYISISEYIGTNVLAGDTLEISITNGSAEFFYVSGAGISQSLTFFDGKTTFLISTITRDIAFVEDVSLLEGNNVHQLTKYYIVQPFTTTDGNPDTSYSYKISVVYGLTGYYNQISTSTSETNMGEITMQASETAEGLSLDALKDFYTIYIDAVGTEAVADDAGRLVFEIDSTATPNAHIEGDKIIFEENYNFEQDYLKIIVKMRISGTERSANTDELIEMATVYLRVNLENDTQLEEGA